MDKLASLTTAHDKLVSESNVNQLKMLCKSKSIQELTSSLHSLKQSSTQTSSTQLKQVQTLEQENRSSIQTRMGFPDIENLDLY